MGVTRSPASAENRISTTSFNSRDAATLAVSATFQGVGEDVSLYGRVGIAVSSDNATDGVLTIEVSHDDITYRGVTRNWSDTKIGAPHMWNIVEQYFRIKYVNGTTEADNLSIQVQYSNNADILLGHQLDEVLVDETEAIISRSVLAGKDPDGVYDNVHTTRSKSLSNTITSSDLGFHAIVTPGGGLKVNELTHLAGAAFGGAVLSTDKWTTDLVGSGTQDATGDGELTMDTGTTANSAVEIQSTDVARFIPANYNTTHHAVAIPDGASYAANNSRKWGAFDATDAANINGVYWELDSGSWYVAHSLNGVATRIAQASWNGVGVLAFPDNSVNTNVYEVEYNAGSVIFRVNGNVMHRVNLTATPYADNIHFPVGMSNTNSGGSTTDVSMKIRAAAIYTLGQGKGVDRPHYMVGTQTGHLVKAGPGHLGKVIIARNGAGGGDVTIEVYDGITAVNQIGRIAIDTDMTTTVDYDITFNNGLFMIVTGLGTLGTTITFD